MTKRELIEFMVWRYRDLAKSVNADHLLKMLDAMEKNADAWPFDKTNRWLGFVQGVLFERGVLDVNEEREVTRPFFHEYYQANGIEIPKSVNVDDER